MIDNSELELNQTSSTQVEIPIPKDAERIPEETVGQLVSEIVSFYNLPPEVKAKGISSQVYKVSRKELAEIYLIQLQRQRARRGEDISLEDLAEEHRQELADFLNPNRDREPRSTGRFKDISWEDLIGAAGFYFPISANQSYIFIDRGLEGFLERRTIRHELLHVMSGHGVDTGAGFYDIRSGRGSPLNEAVTEFLEIYQREQDLGGRKLSDTRFQLIKDGEKIYESPYGGYLGTLGDLFWIIEESGNPMTTQNLSGIYFDHSISPDQRIERLNEEFRARSSDQLANRQVQFFRSLTGTLRQ